MDTVIFKSRKHNINNLKTRKTTELARKLFLLSTWILFTKVLVSTHQPKVLLVFSPSSTSARDYPPTSDCRLQFQLAQLLFAFLWYETISMRQWGNRRKSTWQKAGKDAECQFCWRGWESCLHLDFSVFYVVRNRIQLRCFSFSSFCFLLIRCYNTRNIKNTYFIPWPSLITTVHTIEAWIKGSIRATWVQFFMAAEKRLCYCQVCYFNN